MTTTTAPAHEVDLYAIRWGNFVTPLPGLTLAEAAHAAHNAETPGGRLVTRRVDWLNPDTTATFDRASANRWTPVPAHHLPTHW